MKRKTIITVIIFIMTAGILFSLDFNVSPKEDGALDLSISHAWSYGIIGEKLSNLYSSVAAEQTTFSFPTDVTVQAWSLVDEDYFSIPLYIMTSNSTLSANADILGYKFRRNNWGIDLAFNFEYSTMEIQEIGYWDIRDTRHFYLNDRMIRLVLPSLKARFNYNIEELKLSFGGEYAPWLSVGLQQELTFSPDSSEDIDIASGLADGMESSYTGSAENAFSLNMKIRYDNPYLTPQIFLEYDYLGIEYDMVGIGGPITIDSLSQTLSLDGMFVFSFMKLDDLHPAMTFNYTWNWTTDRSAEEPQAELDDGDISFGFGFEF